MVTNPHPSVNFFLSDLSKNDKPWDKHKSLSVRIANAFLQNKKFFKRGHNLNDCADWLVYHATDDDKKPLRLAMANFCRDRACPVCQWRRSLRWVATMKKQYPQVAKAYPSHRWLFLTLTVKNCQITELNETIRAMNKGFNALIRKLKKRFPTLGYVRTIEVTRSDNDTAHPHFHVMLLVPAEYFGKGYIKQAEWSEMWQKAMKLDYIPVVDIRAVKSKDGNAIGAAIAETMKYSIKPTDLLKGANYDWLYEYFKQVKGLRFVSVGGVLKGLIKAEWETDKIDDDLIHVDGDSENQPVEQTEPMEIRFNFDRMIWRYKH